MAYRQQKVRYDVLFGYKEDQVREIAEAAIELIKVRTLAGDDRYLKSFKNYTEEYADLKGVSQSDVDLYVTGDMLNNLEVLKVTKNYFEIGYASGYDGMGKVMGNRLGTYGNKKPVTDPRDFLGLDDKELNELFDNFPMSDEDELDGEFEEVVDRMVSNMTPAQRERIRRRNLLGELDEDGI